MTGATLSVTLDAREAERVFTHWRRLGRDTTPIMRAVGEKLVPNTHDRFDAGKDPTGQAWAGLSPAYKAVKRGPRILVESGMGGGGLMGSITFDAGRDLVVVGSNKPYAAIHQFGGTIERAFGRVRPVTIPARPYLGISAEDRRDVLDVLEAFYIRGRSV